MKKYLLFLMMALALPVLGYAQNGWDDEEETGDGAYFHIAIGEATAHFQVISESAKTCRLYNDFEKAIENANGDIEIPAVAWGYTVVEVGGDALRGVEGIQKLTLPSTITKLSPYCFEESSITELDLSATQIDAVPVAMIEYSTKLTKVTLPPTVKSIGNYAFSHCEVLPTVDLPEGLTSIGAGAFAGMGESLFLDEDRWHNQPLSMYIPSSVTAIGDGAFNFCLGDRDYDTGVITRGVITSAIRAPFDVNAFGGDYNNYGLLRVATGCQYRYEACQGWGFALVEEIDGLPETDTSISLSDILANGTNGETYQIKDELQVMDQFAVTKSSGGMMPTNVTTYYILATDGTSKVLLQIPQNKYKDLDDILSLAPKSVTGTLQNKDLNPYFVVSSQPVEGDGEDEYEIRQVDLNTYWTPLANEPVTATAFVYKDGKIYPNSDAAGTGVTLDYTYLPNFVPEKGVTYDMKAFTTLKQATVPETNFLNYITIYPYSMEATDEPKVEYTTSLATILSEGVNGQSYIVREKLFVVEKGNYSVKSGTGFFQQTVKYTDVFTTDGNDNWIKLNYLTNTYGASNKATALHAGQIEGILHDVETNPWLEVKVAPTADEGEFTAIKTYDLNERFTAKPNEVFNTIGYVYDNNGVNSLAPAADTTNPTFDFGARAYAVKDTAWVIYPNHYYEFLGVAQVSAPWSDNLNVNSDNYYTNVRVLPLQAVTWVDAMITFGHVNSRNDVELFGQINANTSAKNKATIVEKFMNFVTKGKEYIADIPQMTTLRAGIDGCFIYNPAGIWRMTLSQEFNAKSVTIIARNYIPEAGRAARYANAAYLVLNGVTHEQPLTDEYAEYTFEFDGDTPLSELSIATSSPTYTNTWAGAFVKGIDIVEKSEVVYDPIITLTPGAGEYDEPVTVKVSVEDAPADYKVFYTLVPATTEEAPMRAEAVETEYDDELGITIDQSATLTVIVRDASGAPLKQLTAEYVINGPLTGVNGIIGGKAVKAVRYYNVAGLRSDTPFDGINIVVTEYQDGTTTMTKVVR